MKSKLIALFSALMIVTACAQAADFAAKVTVPFPFYAGSQKYEAGTYKVSNGGGTMSAYISDANRTLGTLIVRTTNNPRSAKKGPTIVFKKIDGVHFLEELWVGDGTAREFPISKLEKELVAKRSDTPVLRIMLAALRAEK